MIMGELERKQMAWEATNVELEAMRRELEQLRGQTRSLQSDPDQLTTSVEAPENLRRELADTRASLQQARDLIKIMQRTKLWKLRHHWFRVKRKLHLPCWERE